MSKELNECSVKGCGNKTTNEKYVGDIRMHICDECEEEKDKPWRKVSPREELYSEETERIAHALRNRGDQRIGQFLLNAVIKPEKEFDSIEERNTATHNKLWNIEAYELLELIQEKDMDADNFKSRDEVFNERNHVVKALFKMMHTLGFEVGYREDDSSEWLVWTIPDQQITINDHIVRLPGQMGWHIHRDEFNPENLDWMHEINTEYDGHTTEDKHTRLNALVQVLNNLQVD